MIYFKWWHHFTPVCRGLHFAWVKVSTLTSTRIFQFIKCLFKICIFFYYTPNFHFHLHMHWYLCSNLCEHTLVILIFPHSFCLFVLSIRMREWWNHWGWEKPKSSFLNTIGGNIYSSFIIKNVVWERNNKRNKNNWKL